MEIKLNQTQQEVFDQLVHFIDHDEFDTFILKGYAGTGKTLLIQEFARHLIEVEKKFLLLATTGRAAAVLRGKTELPTSTIHGALYNFQRLSVMMSLFLMMHL